MNKIFSLLLITAFLFNIILPIKAASSLPLSLGSGVKVMSKTVKPEGIDNFTASVESLPLVLSSTNLVKAVYTNGQASVENFEVAKIFTDGMVLQRNSPVRIFGISTDNDGSTIAATLGAATATGEVLNGKWEVMLPSMSANAVGQKLTVFGADTSVEFNDVLVGDVYFASGQSNMAFAVNASYTYSDAVANAKETDNIRFFYQAQPTSDLALNPSWKTEEQTNPIGNYYWEKVTDVNVGKISAVAYYFAKTVQDKTDASVPIGIIQTAVSGTSLAENSPNELNALHNITSANGSYVYNTMIAPTIKYSAKGMLWYQGESDSHSDLLLFSYPERFKSFVNYINNKNGNDLDILYVQLSSHSASIVNSKAWQVAKFRAMQTQMISQIPNASMIVSMDKGAKAEDEGSATAHPKDKKTLGERIAGIVLYNKNSPMAKTIVYDQTGATVTFDNVGTGLSGKNGNLKGFELIAGSKAYEGIATITGVNTVRVEGILNPTGVRYGYYQEASQYVANLINSDNLPAPTFTDGENANTIAPISRGVLDDYFVRYSQIPTLGSEVAGFDFKIGTQGFTAANGTLSCENEALKFEPLQIDGSIMSPTMTMPSTGRMMKIRYKNTTNTHLMQVFFTTNTDQALSESKKLEVPIHSNMSDYADWYVDLGANTNWKDIITKIRIDPIDEAVSGTVYIESIEFYEYEAPVERFWTFEETQNDTNTFANGWTVSPNGHAAFSKESGNLKINITDADAYMYKAVNIPAKYDKVKIRYKNTTTKSLVQVFFNTASVTNKFKADTLQTNMTDFGEVIIDMSTMPEWTGTITSIRLDIANGVGTNGDFYIESIEVDEFTGNEFTLIPSGNCTISTVAEGGKIYADKTQTFSSLPSELYGANYVKAPYAVSFARTSGEGWAYVITPEVGSAYSIADYLVALGFDKVNIPSFKVWSTDTVSSAIYSKYVYDGDMIQYGMRGITLFSKTSLFPSLEWPLAIIEPLNGASVKKIQTGLPVFADSAQTFDSLPDEFLGQGYIYEGINGGTVGTVKEAGNVYVIAPTVGDNAQEATLISAGYEKTAMEHFNVFTGLTETIGVFKKYLQKDEAVTYSKWQIVVCSPFAESEIFYPSMEPASFFTDAPYKYTKESRLWQGCGDIERASNGRLWAAWYSGGTGEPHKDNYAILGTSDDDGATWTEPVIIIDNLSDYARVLDPTLWIDPTGKMWLFYNQFNGLNTCEPYMGVWAITTENPEEPNPTWSEPKRIMGGFKRNKPIVLSSGEWLMPVYDWMDEKTSKIYISTDQGETWSYQGGVVTGQYNWDEHMVIEKNDGSLWMLIRTGYGIGQSYSYDKGKTWTAMTNSGIAGPSSRFHIRRLPSGNLLLINHYNFTARDHMTALLSTDDGATWSYKLLLDERNSVTYPDAVVTEDGTIYSIYDRERVGASEILMAVFNEEDIMSGAFVSDVAQQKTVVSRLLSDKIKWDFEQGKDMWKPSSNMTFDTSTPGILAANILSVDASMSNSVSFPSSYNKIKLRMKNITNSTTCQVFFGTSKNPGIMGTRQKTFTLERNMTEYKDFVLDMSTMADWSDTITSLRIDIADSATSGTVYIDSIEMIKDYKTKWDFADSAGGWVAQNKVTFDTPVNGELGINITGSDAYIYNPSTDIDGANKKIRVRMKNTTNSASFQVYFTTNSATAFGATTVKSFTTKTNMTEYEDFVFDMSDIPAWKGFIKSLRFDIADSATSGKVYVDSIDVYTDFDVRLSKNGIDTYYKNEADTVSVKISEFMDNEITPILAVYKKSDNTLVNCVIGQKGQKEISIDSISSKYTVKLLCLNDLQSMKPLTKVKTVYDANGFTLIPITGMNTLEVKDNAVIFTDRAFTFINLPNELYKAKFIQASIMTGSSATADGDGWVYVVTPDPAVSPTFSISSTLLANGFTKVNIGGFRLWANQGETCLLYSKYVKNGEAITYGRWGVTLFSKVSLFPTAAL